MNGTFFQNPNFSSEEDKKKNDGLLDIENSYIENVLRQNKGKCMKAYFSYPDSNMWKDKMYEGKIEQASKDHIIILLKNGETIMAPMIYLDYIEFEDKINYFFK